MAEQLAQASSDIGRRDVAIIGSVATMLYMFHGTHSQVVCDMVTGLIPALATYKIILQPQRSLGAFQSILLYWVAHGALSAADSLCSDTSGYYFGKLLLLGIVFAHAVNKNPDIYQTILNTCKVVPPNSVYAETTDFTQQPTRQQTMKAATEMLSSDASVTTAARKELTIRTPTPTGFSDPDEYEPVRHQVMFAQAISSTPYLQPPIHQQADSATISTTQTIPASSTQLVSLPVDTYTAVEGPFTDNEEDDEDATLGAKHDEATTHPKTILESEKMDEMMDRSACGDENETTTDRQTVTITYGDLVTNPLNKINFTSRMIGESALISVTNISENNIVSSINSELTRPGKSKFRKKCIWALKTNAMHRLLANPVCGNIEPGKSAKIRIAITESCSQITQSKDKVLQIYCTYFNRSY